MRRFGTILAERRLVEQESRRIDVSRSVRRGGHRRRGVGVPVPHSRRRPLDPRVRLWHRLVAGARHGARRDPGAARRVGPLAGLEGGSGPAGHLGRRNRIHPLDPVRPRPHVPATPGAPRRPRDPAGRAASRAPIDAAAHAQAAEEPEGPLISSRRGSLLPSHGQPQTHQRSALPAIRGGRSAGRRARGADQGEHRDRYPRRARGSVDLGRRGRRGDAGHREGGRRARPARRELARPGQGRDHEDSPGRRAAAARRGAAARRDDRRRQWHRQDDDGGEAGARPEGAGQGSAGVRRGHLPGRRRRAAGDLGAAGRRRHDPRQERLRSGCRGVRRAPGRPCTRPRSRS